MVKALRAARITGWLTNHPAGPYLIDIAFPDHGVAIEIDGWAFHSDPEKFRSDRRRQNYLILNRWQVLRFTWLDITAYPERVIGTIRSAISAR